MVAIILRNVYLNIDGLVQNYSISIVNTLGILQSCHWCVLLDYEPMGITTTEQIPHLSKMAPYCLNTLRPAQNGRHFADDIFKCIFLNENVWTRIKISLKFVPKGPINNIRALVQIMAWRRPGDKPLSEPMMVRLATHICVTRPQWVKGMPKQTSLE